MLQYDTPIRNKSLSAESFKVEGKDVTRIYANNAPERADKGKDGQYVIIEVKAEVDLNARPQMPSEADRKKKRNATACREGRDCVQDGAPGATTHIPGMPSSHRQKTGSTGDRSVVLRKNLVSLVA